MKRLAVVTALVLLSVLAGLSVHAALRQWTGNFATVLAGEVYRSNQPTAARLRSYARDFGIRTVLNLRGASPGSAWYEAERTAAADLGLRLIDFRMSSGHALEQAQFERLLRLLRDAPKPLLIHCRSGSDRTGLAAVIYLALVAGVDEEVAERQLSIRYGHVALPVLSAAWPMDVSWEQIEDWVGIVDS